jgi:predicted phage terminase large subunit-like protein
MDWYQGVVVQRLLDGGVIVVVMHRLSPDDFCATLEQTGNWEVLRLPLVAEEGITWVDANDNELLVRDSGDLLNPHYKGQADVDALRREIPSGIFEAQCQQRPSYGATGECSIDRLARYDKPPKFELTIHSWDIAATKGGGNYTVCTKFGLAAIPGKGDCLYMIGLIRMQVELPTVRDAIVTQDSVDKPALIVIDGAGIGKGIYQDLQRGGLRHVVTGSAMEQSNAADLKVKRFRAALLRLYDGDVLFPSSASWLATFFHELASFPEGKHKDQVDSMTQLVSGMRTLIAYARQDRRNR